MYDGTISDPEFEFGVILDYQVLATNSHRFWREGAKLADGTAWPDFLVAHADGVLKCGLALMLLRQCSPNHFVCDRRLAPPRFRLSFDSDTVQLGWREVMAYAGRLAGLAAAHARGLADEADLLRLRQLEAHKAAVKRGEDANARRRSDRDQKTAQKQAARRNSAELAEKGRAAEAEAKAMRDVADAAYNERTARASPIDLERERLLDELVQEARDELLLRESEAVRRERNAERRESWRRARQVLGPRRAELLSQIDTAEALMLTSSAVMVAEEAVSSDINGPGLLPPTDRPARRKWDTGISSLPVNEPQLLADVNTDGSQGESAEPGMGGNRARWGPVTTSLPTSAEFVGVGDDDVRGAVVSTVRTGAIDGTEMAALLRPDSTIASARADRTLEPVTYVGDATLKRSTPADRPQRSDGAAMAALLQRDHDTDGGALLATDAGQDQTFAPVAGAVANIGDQKSSSIQDLMYPGSPTAPPSEPQAALLAQESGSDQRSATPAGRMRRDPDSSILPGESTMQDILYPGFSAAAASLVTERGPQGTSAASPDNAHTAATIDSHDSAVVYDELALSGDEPPVAAVADTGPVKTTSAIPSNHRSSSRPRSARAVRDPRSSTAQFLMYPPNHLSRDSLASASMDSSISTAEADARDEVNSSSTPIMPELDLWESFAGGFGADFAELNGVINSEPSFAVDLLAQANAFSGFNPRYAGPEGSEPRLAGTGVKYAPLDLLVDLCIKTPLSYQIRVTSTAIFDYIFDELKLLAHLEALRKFVLLGSGEWANALVDR